MALVSFVVVPLALLQRPAAVLPASRHSARGGSRAQMAAGSALIIQNKGARCRSLDAAARRELRRETRMRSHHNRTGGMARAFRIVA